MNSGLCFSVLRRRALVFSGLGVCWFGAGCATEKDDDKNTPNASAVEASDDDAADDDAQDGANPRCGQQQNVRCATEGDDTEDSSDDTGDDAADDTGADDAADDTDDDTGADDAVDDTDDDTSAGDDDSPDDDTPAGDDDSSDDDTSAGSDDTQDDDSEPEPGEPEPALPTPVPTPIDGPPPGNLDGDCAIPAEARAEDTSNPDRVVGNGNPASCTADAFIDAVARGGVITFDCGPDPVTLTLNRPAKIVNNTGPKIVIDGGGLVTLSGGGQTRILYMNTCDENQVWTTSHCQDQDHPQLTVQNLTFIDANSKNETEYDGGGAIWVRGGRFKVVNSRFFNNVCADTGPDVGGAGIRVFSQYQGLPVYVVSSTFGGAEGLGNVCANGGGISSIGVSWTIINSVFSYNRAIGNGGNPAQNGTPGGGSGGSIYNDGNEMTLSLCGTRIEHNEVNAYGSAIFFVSNNHTGDIQIRDSVITNNVGGSWYPTYRQISNHDDTPINVTNSTIE